MLKRTAARLGNPTFMIGYPVDGGKKGQIGFHGKHGTQKFRFNNRIGDALDWSIIKPEWYWERGGYEAMGNMPKQWEKDGFGEWLVQLDNDELGMLVYDVMHDIILEENLRDGIDLRAPHPDTHEPLYGKIPSFVFQTQGWARPDLRERIQDRLFKAFRITPPFHHRIHITTPVEMVSYIQARVAQARTKPSHAIPEEIKSFLDKLPEDEQPELGMLTALPDKQRTSLREAIRVMYMRDLLWDFTYDPKPKGETEVGRNGMYWLEMERTDRLNKERADAKKDHRRQLVQQRAARRQRAAA
eukprot:TRINITY_DN11705_c0_g1_i1.p2 TRINITY_DN11705_c0_g1~~TRINITY_DN11705_c0_g1_i1.p2  ORF type:complete len:329 (+),score=125.59 TRINITY_DN11705_c0_g1_i1:89-988(+)